MFKDLHQKHCKVKVEPVFTCQWGAQDCSQGKLQWKEVKNNRCNERVTNTAEGDLEIWSHGYYGVAVLKGWYQQRK